MKKASIIQVCEKKMKNGKTHFKFIRHIRTPDDRTPPKHIGPHPRKQSPYAVVVWDSMIQGIMVRES